MRMLTTQSMYLTVYGKVVVENWLTLGLQSVGLHSWVEMLDFCVCHQWWL